MPDQEVFYLYKDGRILEAIYSEYPDDVLGYDIDEATAVKLCKRLNEAARSGRLEMQGLIATKDTSMLFEWQITDEQESFLYRASTPGRAARLMIDNETRKRWDVEPFDMSKL